MITFLKSATNFDLLTYPIGPLTRKYKFPLRRVIISIFAHINQFAGKTFQDIYVKKLTISKVSIDIISFSKTGGNFAV
jgi:hypothetical protein